MDIGKLFSNASCAMTRAVQYTEEKLFNVERTAYNSRTAYLMEQMDLCQTITEKIVKATEAYVQPNPAYRLENLVHEKIDGKRIQHITPANIVSETMLNAATQIRTNPEMNESQEHYTEALRLVGGTHDQIGNTQQEFINNVYTKYIEPLLSYLVQVKNVQKERRELEMKRLDLDAVKTKLKRVVVEEAKKNTEKELKTMQLEFDQQLEVTNLLMENVIASLDYHTRLLCDLVDYEVDYYEQCYTDIVKLRDALKEF